MSCLAGWLACGCRAGCFMGCRAGCFMGSRAIVHGLLRWLVHWCMCRLDHGWLKCLTDCLLYFPSSPLCPVLQVADGAMRCFASLADRFTRRGTDPAPLAKHGLVEELISRLETSAPPAGPGGTPGNLTGEPGLHGLGRMRDGTNSMAMGP